MAKIHDNKKTPSFPFYPKDWLTDLKVQSLSFEEQGIYLNLLCYSWLDDLPSDTEKLAKLLRCDRQAIEIIVKEFFENVDGRLFNKRLEKIKAELLTFRTKMSEAGKKGNDIKYHEKRVKAKKDTNAKRSPSDQKAIAKTRSPIPIPIPIPSSIAESTNVDTARAEQYGNPEINKMLVALKATIGIEMFADSGMERNIGKHLVNLYQKIGKDEFKSRLKSLLADKFKSKNCNRIQYLYAEMKSFRKSPTIQASNTEKI